MSGQDVDKAKILKIRDKAAKRHQLPYLIELWAGEDADRSERVLARAASAPLARAIFKAALSEHPDRRITLKRGGQLIEDSQPD
jgi:hypothetical protein